MSGHRMARAWRSIWAILKRYGAHHISINLHCPAAERIGPAVVFFPIPDFLNFFFKSNPLQYCIGLEKSCTRFFTFLPGQQVNSTRIVHRYQLQLQCSPDYHIKRVRVVGRLFRRYALAPLGPLVFLGFPIHQFGIRFFD